MKPRFLPAAILAGALAGAAGPVVAQAGWYAGLAFGSANVNLDANVVAVGGASSTSFVSDQRDPGVKVFAGHRFNRHFAVEAGYAWLGEFQATNQVSAPSSGALNADIRVIGLFVDALAILPIGERFAAFAKLGVLGSETRTFRSTSGTVTPAPGMHTNASTDEANISYGLGAQYTFAKNVALRLEWQLYADVGNAHTGEMNLDLYWAGLLFLF